eukprot:COSAG05_NODE_157_length_15666_cov_29.830410_15_plen_55_part_00
MASRFGPAAAAAAAAAGGGITGGGGTCLYRDEDHVRVLASLRKVALQTALAPVQ